MFGSLELEGKVLGCVCQVGEWPYAFLQPPPRGRPCRQPVYRLPSCSLSVAGRNFSR